MDYFTYWNILSLIDILGCVAQELLCVFVMCVYISLLSQALYVVVAVFVCTFHDVYIFEYILHDVDYLCVYKIRGWYKETHTYTPMLLTVY